MEANELIFTQQEKDALIPILLPEKIESIRRRVDGFYELTLDESYALILSQQVKDAYVAQGFDIHYELTNIGKVLEGLVDKLSDMGF